MKAIHKKVITTFHLQEDPIKKTCCNSRQPIEAAPQKNWKVYILLSNDGQLYTGITNNMTLRWQKHRKKKGAKFFYGRRPIALNYLEGEHTRSSASKREYEIKKLNKKQKWQLIMSHFGPFNI